MSRRDAEEINSDRELSWDDQRKLESIVALTRNHYKHACPRELCAECEPGDVADALHEIADSLLPEPTPSPPTEES